MTPPTPPNLHDIVVSEPVSWTPQAAGWWIVLGVAALLLGWEIVAGVRRRRADLYRRLALARLAEIEKALAEPQGRAKGAAALPVLVKQTALAFRPRREVASLTGTAWLRFLDQTYGGKEFSEGPGRLLPNLAYASSARTREVQAEEIEALVGLIRRWIRRHARVRV